MRWLGLVAAFFLSGCATHQSETLPMLGAWDAFQGDRKVSEVVFSKDEVIVTKGDGPKPRVATYYRSVGAEPNRYAVVVAGEDDPLVLTINADGSIDAQMGGDENKSLRLVRKLAP